MVSMATSTATLSQLLRHPHDVIDQLKDGDVVLTRREGDALRLSTDSRASRDDEMVAAFAQLIAGIVIDEAVADRLAMGLAGPFPWMEFLGEDLRRSFVGDFLRTARACAEVGHFDRLAVVVANWRETAAAYSLGLDRALAETDYLENAIPAADPR